MTELEYIWWLFLGICTICMFAMIFYGAYLDFKECPPAAEHLM